MNKGLTLVELLVTIAITGIIVAAGVSVHLNHQKIFTREQELVDMRNNIRGALNMIVKDLRMAGYNPTESAVFDTGIVTASSDRIIMRMDIDTNGVWTPSDSLYEQRGFAFEGDSISFIYITSDGNPATELLAKNIESLLFEYLDESGNTIPFPIVGASLLNIRSIRVAVAGRTEHPFSGKYFRDTLTAVVDLRNM